MCIIWYGWLLFQIVFCCKSHNRNSKAIKSERKREKLFGLFKSVNRYTHSFVGQIAKREKWEKRLERRTQKKKKTNISRNSVVLWQLAHFVWYFIFYLILFSTMNSLSLCVCFLGPAQKLSSGKKNSHRTTTSILTTISFYWNTIYFVYFGRNTHNFRSKYIRR